MEQVRAFIAVELPPRVKAALTRITHDLQAVAPEGVRWVKPEGIHLTLKFLGNVGVEALQPITQAMSRCAASVSPFDLFLSELGAFPSLKAPRVVWVGLGGGLGTLLGLQEALEREMEALEFAREGRPFSPHLTLGRAREGISSPQRRRVGEALAQVSMEVREELRVEEIALIQSTLTPSGAIYTRLFSVPLSHG